MVAQPVTTDRIAILARQIASPRPVKPATLARRERAAYRLCEQLQSTLALLDSHGEGVKDSNGEHIGVPAFKELAGISRKYAIPLLEYLDRQRLTRRAGDERVILIAE